jgi:hypothetical protein
VSVHDCSELAQGHTLPALIMLISKMPRALTVEEGVSSCSVSLKLR